MKKRMIAVLLLSVLLLSACAGAGDWSYALPNGYEIWRVNGENIAFGVRNGSVLENALDGSVEAFRYGERYVALRMAASEESGEAFFLVDTEGSASYFAETEDELLQTCESLGVTDLGDWIETQPAPKGAKFPE